MSDAAHYQPHIHPTIDAILRQCADFLAPQQLASKTVTNYLSDIRLFLEWSTGQHQALVLKDLEQDIHAYRAALLDSATPIATINRHLASLRQFGAFLTTVHQIEINTKSLKNISHTPQKHESTVLNTNTQAIEQFGLALAERGCSHSTIENYLGDVRQFAAFESETTLFDDRRKDCVGKFVVNLRENNASSSTIRRKKASLKQFYAWAKHSEYIKSNIFESFGDRIVSAAQQFIPLAFFEKKSTESTTTDTTTASTHPLARAYRTYTKWPISSYLHLAILVLFVSMLGAFGYKQLFLEAGQKYAFPTSLTRPSRVLSFQGRLTDSAGTPITVASNLKFRLFNHITNGTGDGQALWASGTCSITPDQDGIFTSLLGSACGPEIPPEIFSENQNVYLELQVGSETLTPRQQIATVGYALNAETLQGYPASASAVENTIPVFDNNGDLVIGLPSPEIRSTSGTFALKGNALSLATNTGTGGSITLAPDGAGQVNLIGGTTTQDFISITNANLSTGTLMKGTVGNNNTGYKFLSFVGGSVASEKFYVNAFGGVYAGNSLSTPVATISATNTSATPLIINGTGGQILSVANSGNIVGTGTLTGLTGLSSSGTITFSGLNTAGAVAYTQSGGVLGVTAQGNSGYVLTSGGAGTPAWVDPATIGTNYWQLNNKVLAPGNITYDLAVGGNATTSAKFQIFGNTGNATTSGTLTFNGAAYSNNVIAATEMSGLQIGDSNTGNIIFNQNGNVGIGTTSPSQKLDVAGNITASTGFLAAYYEGTYFGRISGGVANNYMVGLSTGTPTFIIREIASQTADIMQWQNSAGASLGVINSAGNVGIGTTSPGSKLQVAGNITPSITSTYDLGTSSLYWNNLYVNNIFSGASGVSGYWQRNNNAVSPTNITDDVLFGGIATSSAKFQIFGNTGNATTAGTLTFNGAAYSNNVIAATKMSGLQIGDSSTGNIIFNQNGNVGIGTTVPSSALTVAGNITLSSSNTGLISNSGGTFILTNGGSTYLRLGGSVPAKVYISDNTNNDTIIGSGGGNVGIGTTTPNFQLQTTSNIESLGALNNPYGGVGLYQNRITQSEAIDTWGVVNVSFVANSVAAPNGETTADTVTSTVSNGYTYNNTTGGTVSGNTYTFSFWARTASGTQTIRYDIAECGYDGGTANTTTATTTWQRYSVTRSSWTNGAGSPCPIIYPVSGGTGSLYVWGAQNEIGITKAGPYVKTSGTAITGSNGVIASSATGKSLFYGSVGIGTIAPNSKLEIAGGNLSLTSNSLLWGTSGSEDARIYRAGAGSIVLDANGTGVSTLQLGASNTIGDAYLRMMGYTGATQTSFDLVNSGALGYFAGGTGVTSYSVRLNNSSTDLFYVKSDGTVGVGTSSPAYNLDVRGTASVSSTLSLGPLTQGGAGACTTSGAGKMYYDGPANSYYYCNGTTWTLIGSGAGGSGVWQELNGTIVPNNSTEDVLIGGQATSSAKFKFMNVSSGTPTASISGSVANVTLVIDGNGNITTTNMQPLVIGNASTGSIQLKPKNTTGLYVDGTGSVGIGTTAPDAQDMLHVKGNILIENGASSTGTTRNKGLQLWTDEAFGMELLYNGSWRTAIYARSADSDIAFGTYAGGATAQNTFAEQMTIDGQTGNVGINNTSPSYKFDVTGSASVSANLMAGGQVQLGRFAANPTTIGAGSVVYNSTDAALYYSNGGSWVQVASGGSTVGGSGTTNYLAKWTSGSALGNSVLYDDGTNIGIGTATPGKLLDVNGLAYFGTANTMTNVLDAASSNNRAIHIGTADAGTTAFGSNAGIILTNTDTTTNNSAQLGFGAKTGASTASYVTAVISAQFGARTNGTYQHGGILKFATSPTAYNSGPIERMRIDATGVIGINTITPRTQLDILGTSGAQLRLTYTDNSVYTGLTTDSSGNFTISATGTKIILSPDLQINGGDILGSAGGTRITLTDALRQTLISGDLVVSGSILNGDGFLTVTRTATISSMIATDMPLRLQSNVGADIFSVDNVGNATAGGQVRVGRFSTNPTTLGTGSIAYNTTDSSLYYSNGTTWLQLATGLSGSGTTNYLTKWISGTALGNSLLYDNGTNVGIGDTTPSKLFVVGNGDLFQVDSSGNAKAPTLALGTGTIAQTDRLFDINTSTAITNATTFTGTTQRTLTGTVTGNIYDYGIYNTLNVGASDGSFFHESRAMLNNLVLNNGNTIDALRGYYGAVANNSATISPSGAANTATISAGITIDAYNNAAGIISNQYGGIFSSFNNSTGSVTSSYGTYAQSYNNATGTITNAIGAQNLAFTNVDGASITSAFGTYSSVYETAAQTTGGITSAYGGYFYAQDATNTYGIWSTAIQNTANTETFGSLYGTVSDCQTNSSSVTVTNCYGVLGRVIETAGTVTTGFAGQFTSTAAMTTGYGVYAQLTGASTNSYGLYSNVTGAGTTNYGLYSNVSGAGTNYAGIFMGGNVGIGTTAPGTALSVNGVISGNTGNLRLQATGTGTGSTGTGSIYFLNSSGTTKGRLDTTTPSFNATGGTIATASGFTTHTFTTTGTVNFTPGVAGNVEYLVIAGGAGGSGAYNGAGGGGGGGGFRTGTGLAVTAQAYTVTVGAGGASSTNGGNSVFGSITSLGGGTGGSASAPPGFSGGSGGGSGGTATTSPGGQGHGTSGQGNGGGHSSSYYTGGAGGGAGAAGAAGAGVAGGAGGDGSSSSFSGSAVTYSGGGGGGGYDTYAGGAGGAGGGGAGGTATTGTAGTANTGGGGGGAGTPAGAYTRNGGAGGSGIVIIRYPTTAYGTLYLNSVDTSSADLAEYYVAGDKSIEAGDVVTISDTKLLDASGSAVVNQGVMRKAEKPYDSKLLGIISTSPGVVIGSIDGDSGKADKRMLALSGRVPVKIDPDSEPIAIGDFLTSSDKPGLAKKAIQAGYTVGKALESWIPGGPDRIEVFINLGYSDPTLAFTNIGEIDFISLVSSDKVASSSGTTYALYDSSGNFIEHAGIFSNAIIANLRAGVITVKEMLTQTLRLNTLLTSPVAHIDLLTSTTTPSANQPGITLRLDPTLILFMKTTTDSTVSAVIASIDTQGNASFSGTLQADSVRTQKLQAAQAELESFKALDAQISGNATISGTLYADSINAQSILGLDDKISSAVQHAMDSATASGAITYTPPASTLELINSLIADTDASTSAYIAMLNMKSGSNVTDTEVITPTAVLVNEFLSVQGLANFNYAEFSTGLTVNGSSQALTVTGNSISLASTTNSNESSQNTMLYIQPSGSGSLSLLGNRMVLSDSGDVSINGNLYVNGSIYTKDIQTETVEIGFTSLLGSTASDSAMYSPAIYDALTNASSSAVLTVGPGTSNRARLLALYNNKGELVSEITASGSATFQDLTTKMITIAAPLTALTSQLTATDSASASSSATLAGTVQSNASAATAVLPAGDTQLTIANVNVAPNTLIYLTPVSNTENQVLYVSAKNDSQGFTVAINQPVTHDITFNYWLIRVQ